MPNWTAEPLPAEPEADDTLHPAGCADPDCDVCVVSAAGARALGQAAGFDYDTLPAPMQAHYRLIASLVMAAMSDALLERGTVKENPNADPAEAGPGGRSDAPTEA